jgi:signal transduction histidine kinase
MVEDDADAVTDKALVICDHDGDQVCLGHRSERTVREVSAAESGVLPSAERAWAATGIVLAAGLSAFAVVLVLGLTHTGHPHGGLAAAAGVLAMTVPIAWAYRAPLPTLAVLLGAAVLNGLVFGSMVRCGGTLPALLYATACAGARPWNRRTALCIVLALMAAVTQAFSDPNLGPGFLIFGVPVILAFAMVGRLAGQRQEAVADLRRRNADLAAQRERTAALSVMVERERVTGDLDALLRRNLDRISAAARNGYIATASPDGPADPELARAAFTEIEACGRDGLSMIRALIQDLRRQPTAGP